MAHGAPPPLQHRRQHRLLSRLSLLLLLLRCLSYYGPSGGSGKNVFSTYSPLFSAPPLRAFHYNPALSLFCIHEEEGSEFFSSFPSLVRTGHQACLGLLYIAAAAAVELLQFFQTLDYVTLYGRGEEEGSSPQKM